MWTRDQKVGLIKNFVINNYFTAKTFCVRCSTLKKLLARWANFFLYVEAANVLICKGWFLYNVRPNPNENKLVYGKLINKYLKMVMIQELLFSKAFSALQQILNLHKLPYVNEPSFRFINYRKKWKKQQKF